MKASLWRPVRQRVSTQVVVLTVAILALTMAAGFFVVQLNLRRQIQGQYEGQALSVAQALAADPDVASQVAGGRPGGALQRLATQVKTHTGALFVVITDAGGIRYTHPNPRLIGKPVSYPDPEPTVAEPFLTGRPFRGLEHGSLGPEAVGKVPLRENGKLAGEVSVGFPVERISRQLGGALPTLAVYFLLVLAVGVLAALGLARRLKKQTFGLELNEIAALLQEREAMLHGIREAVLGYDSGGKILLANDAARQVLGLPPVFLGRPLRDVLPPGRIADVATGEITGTDLLVVFGDRVLVANRMPIRRNGRQQLGWVVTFQDRTESESLKRQLDEVTGLTETLRAQSHEFANRLHTLVGLVELGHADEAVRFVTGLTAARGELTDQLMEAIGEPQLAALVLAKVSLASERGVRLTVTPDSRIRQRITSVTEVLTIVGNLIDNAIDAAAQAAGDREAELTLIAVGPDLMVRVRDSGPGVPEDMRDRIFTDGVTTKESAAGARRGLGLALVRQIVERRGGTIRIGQDDGAVFTATLPAILRSEDGAAVRGAR